MNVIVTCGPSYEPIDQVRRLTNFSTGRLGVTLANYLSDAGHEVTCFRGEGSTFAGPVRCASVQPFATNEDLTHGLEKLSRGQGFDAVFHAAALCDYRVDHVLGPDGKAISSAKFATQDGQIQLVLVPASKVLPRLPGWFPQARIVGWKYELAGSRDAALAKARQQIFDCHTDACVLNGTASGDGFAVCDRAGGVQACRDSAVLCETLLRWMLVPKR